MNKKELKRKKEKSILSKLSVDGQIDHKRMIALRVKNTEARQKLASKLAKQRKEVEE